MSQVDYELFWLLQRISYVLCVLFALYAAPFVIRPMFSYRYKRGAQYSTFHRGLIFSIGYIWYFHVFLYNMGSC